MEIFGSERTDDGWSHSVTRRRFVVIVHFTIMNLKARIGILLSVICLSWYPFDCSATTLLDLQDGSSARESEEIDFRTFATRALKKSKGSKKAKSYKKSKSYDYEPMYHYHDSWTYETAYRPGKSDSYDYSSADYSSYSYSKKSKSGKKSKGFKSYKKYPFIYKYRSFKKSKKFKKYPKYSFKRPTRPEEPDDAEEPTQTILEIAAETLELSTLVTLVTSEGQENVLEMLKGEGPFTLFAPVNSAFDELFETVDPTTLTDEQISDVLFYHVVWDLYLEEDFIISESGILSASNGDPIQYDYDGDDVTLNNEVLIVTADILATNGVIHLVDKVLLPPDNTIADELEELGTFGTLLQLLDEVGFQSIFDDETAGPYTVFAPTDAAFAALLLELGLTLDQVISDRDNLSNILQYHVVEGAVGSGDLEKISSIGTLQGGTIQVDGTTLNSDAEITLADILASNGVIHVIDAVLLPSDDGDSDPIPDDGDEGAGTNGTDTNVDDLEDDDGADAVDGNTTDVPVDGTDDSANIDEGDVVPDTNTTDTDTNTTDTDTGDGGILDDLGDAVDNAGDAIENSDGTIGETIGDTIGNIGDGLGDATNLVPRQADTGTDDPIQL